jgi:TolB protein
VSKPRLLAGLVILAVLLAATSIIASVRLQPEHAVNRIAFVDVNGIIHTIRPDGSDVRRVSPEIEGFFTWPTWSPDGRTLVYSGVTDGEDSTLNVSLFASSASGSQNREIYRSEPGIVGLLAEGVVHYPLWSPDSQQVAFISTTSRGLTLFIDDLNSSEEPQYVLDNGPLWINWSPDSRQMLVHRGTEHFMVSAGGEVQVKSLDIDSDAYRVPAWKPTGEAITFATIDGPFQYTVLSADVVEASIETPKPLRTVQPVPAFLWSPDGQLLAIASSSQVFVYQGLEMYLHRNLTIVPENNPDRPTIVRDPVLAFFWSPDSTKLAYVTLSDTRGVLRWMVVDFIPSLEQLTMFQFFDQYAYSHSLWSPDSDALVFAGSLRSESITASYEAHPGHQGLHVVVVNIDGVVSPQTIAEGFLAFWSPR